MAHLKYHWAAKVPDPSKCRNAWKAYTGGHYARACGRRYANASFPDTAAAFVTRAKRDPDWHCLDCVKAARLALAAESAPKPDTVIWPKPRPISDAPKDGCILGWVPDTDELRAGWELLHYSVSATEWHDNAGVAHEPTHFLPLPPEVM